MEKTTVRYRLLNAGINEDNKNATPTSKKAREYGRETKISKLPLEISRDWRRDFVPSLFHFLLGLADIQRDSEGERT